MARQLGSSAHVRVEKERHNNVKFGWDGVAKKRKEQEFSFTNSRADFRIIQLWETKGNGESEGIFLFVENLFRFISESEMISLRGSKGKMSQLRQGKNMLSKRPFLINEMNLCVEVNSNLSACRAVHLSDANMVKVDTRARQKF